MNDSLPVILGGQALLNAVDYVWPPATDEIRTALERVYSSGNWGRYRGEECDALATELGEYLGVEHVELCCSGTAAVELALRGLRVSEGDEVILCGYDFKGNFSDVLAVGGAPVLVDPDPRNWNLKPDTIVEAISDRTKAVLISHLHGGVVPMPDVMQVASERGIPVIEDAAQMPGATVCGRAAGTWGDVGVFSLGGSKLLSSGRGGVVFTNDVSIAQRIRLHCNRGNHAFPLSELQAAVVRPQLESLDASNAIRTTTVNLLRQAIAPISGLRPFEDVTDNSVPGYYKVGFQYYPDSFAGLSREQFLEAMQAEGAPLFAGFRSLHASHSPRRYRAVGELKEADRADRDIIVLHHPALLHGEDFVDLFSRTLSRVERAALEIFAKLTE